MHQSYDLTHLGWVVFLIVGAAYVTAQLRLHPDRWRSRRGSLVPALCLVVWVWLAAAAVVVLTAVRRHW